MSLILSSLIFSFQLFLPIAYAGDQFFVAARVQSSTRVWEFTGQEFVAELDDCLSYQNNFGGPSSFSSGEHGVFMADGSNDVILEHVSSTCHALCQIAPATSAPYCPTDFLLVKHWCIYIATTQSNYNGANTHCTSFTHGGNTGRLLSDMSCEMVDAIKPMLNMWKDQSGSFCGDCCPGETSKQCMSYDGSSKSVSTNFASVGSCSSCSLQTPGNQKALSCSGTNQHSFNGVCYTFLTSGEDPWETGFAKCAAMNAVYGGYFDKATHDFLYPLAPDRYFLSTVQNVGTAPSSSSDYSKVHIALDANRCNVVLPPNSNAWPSEFDDVETNVNDFTLHVHDNDGNMHNDGSDYNPLCMQKTCTTNPCLNGGTCFQHSTGPVCSCPPGNSGETCSEGSCHTYTNCVTWTTSDSNQDCATQCSGVGKSPIPVDPAAGTKEYVCRFSNCGVKPGSNTEGSTSCRAFPGSSSSFRCLCTMGGGTTWVAESSSTITCDVTCGNAGLSYVSTGVVVGCGCSGPCVGDPYFMCSAVQSGANMAGFQLTNHQGGKCVLTSSNQANHNCLCYSPCSSNSSPVAAADTETTPEDTAKVISPMANDSDPDGDTVSISSITQPSSGTAVDNGDGTVTYTPNAGFAGSDSFTYTVSDGTVTATGTVSITVTAECTDVTWVYFATTGECYWLTTAQYGVNAQAACAAQNGRLVTIKSLAEENYVTSTLLYGGGAFWIGLDDIATEGTYLWLDGDDSASTYVNWQGSQPATSPGYNCGTTMASGGFRMYPCTGSTKVAICEDVPLALSGYDACVADSSSTSVGSSCFQIVDPSPTVPTTMAQAQAVCAPDGYLAVVSTAALLTSTQSMVTASGFSSIRVGLNQQTPAGIADGWVWELPGGGTDPLDPSLWKGPGEPNDYPSGSEDGEEDCGGIRSGNPTKLNDEPYDWGHYGHSVAAMCQFSSNDAPVGTDDTESTNEDTAKVISPLTNDSDPDSDTLSIDSISVAPTSGTAVDNGDGTITYTPNANFFGTDTITYVVSDGTDTDTAVITITVNSVNDIPVAADDTDSTNEDTPVVIDVKANDADADVADTLAISAISTPTQGGTAVNIAGSITYTPAAGWSGTDTFTYTISDGNGGTDTATVTVTVASVNDPPVAVADTLSTPEDTAVVISPLANDSDPESDTLSIQSISVNPTSGTAVDNGDGTITYTPNANFFGTDTITYVVGDGTSTDTAVITVTVNSVNDVPVATDDTDSTNEDTPVVIDVKSNDVDADTADTLAIAVASSPGQGGTAVKSGSGTITYTPPAGWSGTDTFTYTISDGNGGTDTATVTVTVASVNDPPVAVADTATTPEDTAVVISPLTNDSDPESDTLSISAIAVNPTSGTAVNNGDGTITYTPNSNYAGSDTFTYTLSDGNGATDTGTVTVTVTAVNDPPVAVADTATTNEDTAVIVSPLTNDSDPESDTLSISSISVAAVSGTAVDNGDGTITYTPNANYHGSDSFTYIVSDGNGGTDSAVVTVTMSSVNDVPVATDDVISSPENTVLTVTSLTNDLDDDSDTLTITAITQPTFGTAVDNGDGTVTFTPNTNYFGPDSFTYTISDGNGGTDTGTVTLTITAVDCRVGEWTNYTECTATCGEDVIRQRTRNVSVEPVPSGKQCPPLTDEQSCGLKKCEPLTGAVKTIAEVFQTLGCIWILIWVGATIVGFAFLRIWNLERLIHFSQEVSLFIGHIFVLTLRDIVEERTVCTIAGVCFQYFFLVYYFFLPLEAIQSYCLVTNVLSVGGFFNIPVNLAIGWGMPAVITGITAALHHSEYVADFSCWLNLGHDISLASLIPVGLTSLLAIIVAEAAGQGEHPLLPSSNKSKVLSAQLSAKGVLVMTPLSIAHWFAGLFAIYYQHIGLFTVVFVLNIATGVAIFVFHTAGSKEVRQLFIKIWNKVKCCKSSPPAPVSEEAALVGPAAAGATAPGKTPAASGSADSPPADGSNSAHNSSNNSTAEGNAPNAWDGLYQWVTDGRRDNASKKAAKQILFK